MQEKNQNQIYLYMFIAYFFSIFSRMIWVYQFYGNDNSMWNGQLMINTNDGYFYAEQARDILNGSLGYIESLGGDGAAGALTAIFINILPFELETVILYMPAFLSSLLVIPLILIGYSLKAPFWGFLAALFASIVWSYYNRTMVGYYDSDMLNIVMPMFVLWTIIHSILYQKNRYLVMMVIAMILSQWWYPKNISLNTAMIIMAFLYVLIQDRKNIFNIKLIIFAFVGLSLLSLYIKGIFLLVLYLSFHYREESIKKYIYLMVVLGAGLYVYSGAFNTILSSLELYLINRFFPTESVNLVQLHFYNVITTVREAGSIPFETFANRISGHTITFILSTVGVVLMMIRYPVLLISVPMIAMGFMAYKSGLRFTVYAVPIYALGLSYLILLILMYLENIFMDKQIKKKVKYIFIPLAMIIVLVPNINHIIEYKVPTVLNKTEVSDLDKLEKISSSKDYTLSWWDYGYPIRFYSNTNTLIDGGKHQNDNYIISKIMQSSSPEFVANLSRLAVETYEDSNYSVVADTLLAKSKNNVDELLLQWHSDNYRLPQKTRDIYLYLPYRMLNIFPTVAVFGNINLTTGNPERNIIFYPVRAVQQKKNIITLQGGILFDSQKGEIHLGKQKFKLKYFIVTQNTQDNQIKLQSQHYHNDGTMVVIFMKSYGQFVVMDSETFKSTYVQMFILGKYDKKLFELVVASPYSRIYKLKK